MLLLCFFLSGFAALLYETAWTREFEFVFGTSELAVVSVLAAYMAGLAMGSAAAERLLARIRRPVLCYGLLELGIALSALAVPSAIRIATWIHRSTMGGLDRPPDGGDVSAALFYVAATWIVLLVPTGLMGATLPLLARHAVRTREEIGRRVGTLYAVNTLGAVAGTVATGFILLPELGLRATVWVGAATNAGVFVGAALLARGAAVERRTAPPVAVRRPDFHWVLPLVTASGFVSFTYEVLWTRLIGQIVGGTVQGFSTMLGSFLLGIAIGGGVGARLARDPARSLRGLVFAQLGTAALSMAAFLGMDRVPGLAESIGAGSAGALAANALVAACVILPSSVCIGAVFPFAVRVIAESEAEAGPATARVYVWNTAGSILGALGTGFFVLPSLRFDGTVALAVGLSLAVAIALSIGIRPFPRAPFAVAAVGFAALVFAHPATPWRVLRHSAMLASNTEWSGEIDYYGVGRSSTVLLVRGRNGWQITNNGLPESTIHRPGVPDHPTPAHWLGMLPALLRPGLDSQLVIGLGGGLTLESIPSSVKEVVVIELEDEVVRAHRWLAARRESVLDDPRVHVVVNDARGALELTDRRFGAIVSQPSHPWTAGASHLYTREFFSLVADHLEPGGIFGQWIGLTFVDPELLRRLVATLVGSFPHVALFRPTDMAILFMASDQPIAPLDTALEAIALAPRDLARLGVRTREDVAAVWDLDSDGARAFAAGRAPITDDDNPLATRSAHLGYSALGKSRANRLLAPYLIPPGDGTDLDLGYLVRRMIVRSRSERAQAVALAAPDPADRYTALGWLKSATGPQGATAVFRRALEADPEARSARFGLTSVLRARIESEDPEALAIAGPLDGVEGAVVAGWRHAARGDWKQVRALEPALAAARPLDPGEREAMRLRIQWRLESDDPAARAEAVELSARLVELEDGPSDLVLRARTLARADRTGDALQMLELVAQMRRRGARDARRAAVALLDEMRPDLEPERWSSLRQQLLQTR